MTTVLVGPQVVHARHLAIKYAVALEAKGIRYSRGSVYALAKRTFDVTGNKARVATQVATIVDSGECCA